MPPARTFRFLALAAALAACGDGTSPDVQTSDASFAHLESRLFTPSCATSGCHDRGTAAAGLDLTAGRAHAALVGVTPTTPGARSAGMLRVRAGDPEGSLLYHKLAVGDGHHAGDYGNPMPLGADPITVGQLEFVRRWIAAGAPRAGAVADTALMADRTAQLGTVFEPLAAPPAGAGLQLRIDRFGVAPNFERELFVFRRLGNPEPLHVTRIQTKMRPGSHHLLLYTFPEGLALRPTPDVVRDIRRPDGTLDVFQMLPMAYHVFFAGSMTPTSDYAFPPGVALRLPPNAGIDLNAHYVNRTTTERPGEAQANLWTVPASQVQRVARTLNCGNTSLSLPPMQRTTVTHTCRFAEPTTVFLLTSHMHALGERFVIQIVGGARDGETVYESTDWEHPLIKALATPIVLQPNEGLRAVVTYNNTTSRTVTFGLTSTDEMGIIFGYAY